MLVGHFEQLLLLVDQSLIVAGQLVKGVLGSCLKTILGAGQIVHKRYLVVSWKET